MSDTSDFREQPTDRPSDELPTRRFGWWDMFVHPDEDPRPDGGFQGERATLVGYLRNQRLTLEMKCAGLTQPSLTQPT
jgi:hypothetical protein